MSADFFKLNTRGGHSCRCQPVTPSLSPTDAQHLNGTDAFVPPWLLLRLRTQAPADSDCHNCGLPSTVTQQLLLLLICHGLETRICDFKVRPVPDEKLFFPKPEIGSSASGRPAESRSGELRRCALWRKS